MMLYEIAADYRPNNPNKPKYYVAASTVKEAKDKFSDVISWLKIYSVEVVDPSTADIILSEPSSHIILE